MQFVFVFKVRGLKCEIRRCLVSEILKLWKGQPVFGVPHLLVYCGPLPVTTFFSSESGNLFFTHNTKHDINIKQQQQHSQYIIKTNFFYITI